MNQSVFIRETMQLALVADSILQEIGCVHKIKVGPAGGKIVRVPIERTRYDPEEQLVWVEFDLNRLPRGFTLSSLLARGFEQKATAAFKNRVTVFQLGQRIVVASTFGHVPMANGQKPDQEVIFAT